VKGAPLFVLLAASAAVVAACSLGFGENFSGGPAPEDASAGDGTANGDDASTTDAGVDAAASDDVTRGLVLHYRFDEMSGSTVVDDAPAHNDGAFVVGTNGPPTRVAGVRGTALSFAGGARIETPYHPSLAATTPFSVSMWVNAPAAAGDQPRLIAFGSSWDIKLNNRSMQLELDNQYATPAYELPNDRWTPYALVFEAGRAHWFVDGLSVSNSADVFDGTKSARTTTSPIRLANNEELNAPYTGTLDDVRVYGVALTQAEITTLARR